MNFLRLRKLGVFTLVSVLLAGLPMIFAAPVIRVARASFSALWFWIAFTLAAAALWFSGLQSLAIGFYTLTLLVGVFFELEKVTRNMFVAGAVSVMIASVATVSATQQWLSLSGETLEGKARGQIEAFVGEAQKKIGSDMDLNVDTLMGQLPSALIGVLLLALALSLIFESQVRFLFREDLKPAVQRNLRAFKLPDFFIWIAMVSFLFSFVKLNNPTIIMVGSNVLNVMVVLYFFQGLAIVDSLFIALRMNSIFRAAIYFVLLFQLFFLVAAVGFIDYWVNFRNRLLKLRQHSV